MSDRAAQATSFEDLLAGMEAEARQFLEWLEANPDAWNRGPAGKWTAGQHAEHIASAHAVFADSFERGEAKLRSGALGRPPWRDPLQGWFVRLVTSPKFPKGGRAPKFIEPGDSPDRAATLDRLHREVPRYRAIVQRLSPEERERLWTLNPLSPFPWWHYTLAEVVRLHASHTRHHAALARAGAGG